MEIHSGHCTRAPPSLNDDPGSAGGGGGGTSMQYLHALSMLLACTTDSVVYVSGDGAHITAYRYSHIFFLFCRMSWHSHCYCSSLLASALILSWFGTIAMAI